MKIRFRKLTKNLISWGLKLSLTYIFIVLNSKSTNTIASNFMKKSFKLGLTKELQNIVHNLL